MSRKETFIPRHIALYLLAGEQMGVGAEPEIADAGEEIGIEGDAGADIDRGDDRLEALEALRLVDRKVRHGHDETQYGADHAEIDQRIAGPAHGLPVLERDRNKSGQKQRGDEIAHTRLVGTVGLEQQTLRPSRGQQRDADEVDDGKPGKEGDLRDAFRQADLRRAWMRSRIVR